MDVYLLCKFSGDLPIQLLEEGEPGNRVRAMAKLDGPRWATSAGRWQPLGMSARLARAQARSGDRHSAEQTLDLLDSPADARRWALGE